MSAAWPWRKSWPVMARDVVKWGRLEIPYSYKRSARKTLAISVHPDLAVEVRVPLDTPLEIIRERVLKRAAWIRKMQHEFELYLPKQPPRRYVNGETHRYLGRQYRLKADQGKENSVKCLRGYLLVTSRTEPTSDRIKNQLEEWYRHHARRVFRERLAECCRRAALEGIAEPPLIIRKMKTRWGSCSAKGKVYLNLELIKASKECIDYVIMHELCHLKVASHGQKFRMLLARLMPDFEERKKKLNQFADI
ncbi:MAG: SprT family zinc-dependent metalloprotease [Desulfobulbaceae bacterium]